MVALTLIRLISRTDERVLNEHWSGGGNLASLAESIANIAPMLLPRRVSRILSSKVELAPAAQSLASSVEKRQPFVVEIPQAKDKEKVKIASPS